MKERTNAKEEPRTADKGKIVELTPKMALADQSQAQIIELTNALDGPQISSPQSPSVEQPVQTDAPSDRIDEAPAPPSEPSQIEQQVDAAFEAAQIDSAGGTNPETRQGQLLDQLSNLTDMVDNAVNKALKAENDTMTQETPTANPAETAQNDEAERFCFDEPEFDEAQLTRDAALIDAALDPELEDDMIELIDIVDPAELDPEAQLAHVMLETDQEDEAPIELTDIVEKQKRQTAEPMAPTDSKLADDQVDLIELTDIVDPAEVRVETQPEPKPAPAPLEAFQTDDEEIIDLTDIVDPAEVWVETQPESKPAAAPLEAFQTDDDEIIELTDIVDPAELEILDQTVFDVTEATSGDEDIIELTDVVDPALYKPYDRDELPSRIDRADDIIELTDIINPAELKPSETPKVSMSPESNDAAPRRTDVLSQRPKQDPAAKGDKPSRLG